MLKTAVFLSGFLALAWSQSTPVSRCIYDNAPMPINTYIEDCPSPPCQLPQLQDVVFHIVFQAPYTMRSMKTLAVAYVFGPVGVPYGLGEEEITCNFLTNTYCPVLENEVIMYTLRMYIQPAFPVGISVTIEFKITDENENSVMCIRLPVTIIAALPSSATVRQAVPPAGNTTMPLIVKLNAGL